MEQSSKIILVLFSLIMLILGYMVYVTLVGEDEEKIHEVGKGINPPKGNISSQIIIIEFSDFQCPFCKRALPLIKKILNDYNILFYYRNFPLKMHENSFLAAEAAQCASDQGMFWEYHNILFENQDALEKSMLVKYSKEIGLNIEEFEGCLNLEKYKKMIESDINEGNSLGITGTPTFFVNGKKVVGIDETLLRQRIEEEINKIGSLKNLEGA